MPGTPRSSAALWNQTCMRVTPIGRRQSGYPEDSENHEGVAIVAKSTNVLDSAVTQSCVRVTPIGGQHCP